MIASYSDTVIARVIASYSNTVIGASVPVLVLQGYQTENELWGDEISEMVGFQVTHPPHTAEISAHHNTSSSHNTSYSLLPPSMQSTPTPPYN